MDLALDRPVLTRGEYSVVACVEGGVRFSFPFLLLTLTACPGPPAASARPSPPSASAAPRSAAVLERCAAANPRVVRLALEFDGKDVVVKTCDVLSPDTVLAPASPPHPPETIGSWLAIEGADRTATYDSFYGLLCGRWEGARWQPDAEHPSSLSFQVRVPAKGATLTWFDRPCDDAPAKPVARWRWP